MLPAARTPPHTNDVHVLSWVYRGSGYLDIGDHRYERERGVATWIPAGLEHVTGFARTPSRCRSETPAPVTSS